MYNTNVLDGTITEVAVDRGNQKVRTAVRTVSTVAVGLIASATVLASDNSVSPCEQVGRELRSLDVPVETMILNRVDHVPVDRTAVDPDDVKVDLRGVESDAPIIFLTPRVTSILRDVFSAGDEDALEVTEAKSVSPVADSEDVVDIVVAPLNDENETIDLPLYQHQMYRKDI